MDRTSYHVLGQSHERKDAYEKVTGKAKFAADISYPGMVFGGVLRSTIAAGYIKNLDAKQALEIPGVLCVLTHKDIPGLNRTGIILKDEPILVDEKIRRIGDALAVVAAESKELVQKALAAIEVEYAPIESVNSPEDAMRDDAPIIHGNTNLHQEKHLFRGDVEAAFNTCDIIIENTYHSGPRTHMFIEPDAGVASYKGEILTIETSTQNPHFDRGEVANMLALPHNKVNVVQVATGGGFGGKLDTATQCHIALLCHHLKRPVKMVRSRAESTLVSSKRHPLTMHYKTGAMNDGRVVALQVKIIGDTGAYASYGPAVISRAVVHATGPYEIENVDIKGEFYYTNNPMFGAFRGFGVPQVAVAHEGQMNALAKRLNMDPIEVRLINAHRVGSTISTGQVLHDSVGFVETLEKAREMRDSLMSDLKPSGPNKKRGLGVGSMFYGVGNTGLPNPAGAFVEVLGDCSVNLLVGCADIGQGSTTVMAQICAEELGLNYEDINVTFAQTLVTPEGGATSASRQTFISGKATQNAAAMAKETLIEVASDYLKVPKERLIFRARKIWDAENEATNMTYAMLMMEMKRTGKLALGSGSYNPQTTYLSPVDMSGIPYEVYAYGTAVVDLEVDLESGKVDLQRVISVHDVGTCVNPAMVEGQIEGGVAMGIGHVLSEEIEIDQGAIKNLDFTDYIVPTTLDIPEIHTGIVESSGESGPFGAKGVGEPALIPTIPAVIDAINHAADKDFKVASIKQQDIVLDLAEKKPLDKYVCILCGYEYDPLTGDPKQHIPPNVPFDELPDDWVCPICGAGKKDFAPSTSATIVY